MKHWLHSTLLLTVLSVSAMHVVEELPIERQPSSVGEKLSEESALAQRVAEQHRLALQNQSLLADSNFLRTIKKQPVAVVVTPEVTAVQTTPTVLNNRELQEQGLTEEQLKALESMGTSATPFSQKRHPQQLSQPAEMQTEIKKAENTLVEIVELTKKIHGHALPEDAIPVAEEMLNAVIEFEEKIKKMNVSEVTQSGLQEKIAAVKALLDEAIAHQKGQLDAQVALQQEAEARAQAIVAQEQETERQQELKIATYLADPSLQKILAKPFDSISRSDLVVNLELLGLRDFSLDEELARLPIGSSERAQLMKVQQFELLAFRKLEKEAPSFSAVKNKILDLIGFTGERGDFRKQTEEKIAFLQDKRIMDQLDPVSKQYAQEAIDQFNEAVQKVIGMLTYPDEDVVGSLEEALSQFESQAGSNGSYNQQNELYRLVHQLESSAEVLRYIASGISLPLTFARGTYIEQFKAFNKVSGQKLLLQDTPSDKDIVGAIRELLSPEFSVKFLDSKEGSADWKLGQQVAGKVGKEVLAIPLGSLTTAHGYVLSEADGQQVKLAFETLIKELGADSSLLSSKPESWHYLSYDFLEKVGDAWLRGFNKNNVDLSDVVKFKKEQVLCEAWQVAKLDSRTGAGRIMIFRQISTELLTYPLAKSLLTSLESGTLREEPFTEEQRDQAAWRSAKEDNLLPKAINDLSTFLSVKQGPARAGVDFLQDMQTALSDSERIQQMIEQKQLPFVMKELTSFQQSVLQGKSVDDFSNTWWQVELYQQAELFKQAIDTLRIATSDPSPEVLQQLREDTLQHYNELYKLNRAILDKSVTVTFEEVQKAMQSQPLQVLDGVLREALSMDSWLPSLPEEHQLSITTIMRELPTFYTHADGFLKKIGNYQQAALKNRWQQRVSSVLDQSKSFPAQTKQWDTWNAKQSLMSSDELREQQQTLGQFLQQVPTLLKQVNDLLAYDPKSPNAKELKAYKKQLEKAQKKYAPYLIRWNKVLADTSLTAFSDGSDLSAGYQKKAKALVGKLASMNKADAWQALDSEYVSGAFAKKNPDQQKAFLDSLVDAKAAIETVLSNTPNLLEQVDELTAVLSRSPDNNDLVAQLAKARGRLIENQETYAKYVAEWKIGLAKFGPHK